MNSDHFRVHLCVGLYITNFVVDVVCRRCYSECMSLKNRTMIESNPDKNPIASILTDKKSLPCDTTTKSPIIIFAISEATGLLLYQRILNYF